MIRTKIAFLVACSFFAAGSAAGQSAQSSDLRYVYIGEGWRNLRAFHMQYGEHRELTASLYYACGARVFIELGIRESARESEPMTPAATSDQIRFVEGGERPVTDYPEISQNQLVAACAKPPIRAITPEYIVYGRGAGRVFLLIPPKIEVSESKRVVWVSQFLVSNRNYVSVEYDKLFGPAYVTNSSQYDNLTKFSIDCYGSKIRVDIFVQYAPDGNVLDSIEVPSGDGVWASVIPGSIGEAMANIACDIR